MRTAMTRYLGFVLVLIIVTVSPSQAETASREAGVPLYDNLGDHHVPITTDVPEAQQYFDQGMRLTYAFNHEEAIRSFREAARLDPDCAMCYWGIALALGPNINLPMQEDSVTPAMEALETAQALADTVSPREQAYIQALSHRYVQPAPEDRSSLDQAYAQAMGEMVEQYPEDPDAATLYAEALMNLSPWDYWHEDNTPAPNSRQLLSQLERVIEADPDHPGACHYYIHAVEAAYPERAVPCADRLAELMPGAGHLVHMPAHIYILVGRWDDAIEANLHAVHADEGYITDRNVSGFYPALYYPHNYHFLAFAGMMAGRPQVALDASEQLIRLVDPATAWEIPELQGLSPYHQLTLLTFEQYDEVLASPELPIDLPLAYGLDKYARGMALTAGGDTQQARAALEKVRQASTNIDEEPAVTLMDIAEQTLAGEIAAADGNTAEAIERLQTAVVLEDQLPYMEPPYWYRPVRHFLGAALLESGQPAEAERVYREDLERFPENAWSLEGLARSLEAQGKNADADHTHMRLRRTMHSHVSR